MKEKKNTDRVEEKYKRRERRNSSAGKTYLGMKRETQVTSSFTGAAARHGDKKHMQATKAGSQTHWHREGCL